MLVRVGGWWRGVILQSGWGSHTIYRLDPVGGVLSAKPRGAALQAQAPLCPDRPVNQGEPRGPRGPMCTLTLGPLWTNTPSALVPWQRERCSPNNSGTATLSETSFIPWHLVCPLCFSFQKKLNLIIDGIINWLWTLKMMCTIRLVNIILWPNNVINPLCRFKTWLLVLHFVKLNVYSNSSWF